MERKMSNYCDFNPKKFKEFVSKHKKINPAMADDWEIIPETWRGNDGFSLRSEKLKQEVADINLRRFLRFSKEQNLTIIGLKLQGNYIIGNDRSVYTEEMYNQWREKFEKRTETIIPKTDWKVGHEYLTPCGKTHIYLGDRYVSNIKDAAVSEYRFDDITKITRKSFVAHDYNGSASHFKGKFTEDKGQKMTVEECDVILEKYYNKNIYITYFGKELVKDPKYGIIEHALPKKFNTEYYYSKRTLIGKKGDYYYINNTRPYLEVTYFGPEIEMPVGEKPEGHHWQASLWERQMQSYNLSQTIDPGFYASSYRTIDPKTFVRGAYFESGYSYNRRTQPDIKLDKIYRIGLIE